MYSVFHHTIPAAADDNNDLPGHGGELSTVKASVTRLKHPDAGQTWDFERSE